METCTSQISHNWKGGEKVFIELKAGSTCDLCGFVKSIDGQEARCSCGWLGAAEDIWDKDYACPDCSERVHDFDIDFYCPPCGHINAVRFEYAPAHGDGSRCDCCMKKIWEETRDNVIKALTELDKKGVSCQTG